MIQFLQNVLILTLIIGGAAFAASFFLRKGKRERILFVISLTVSGFCYSAVTFGFSVVLSLSQTKKIFRQMEELPGIQTLQAHFPEEFDELRQSLNAVRGGDKKVSLVESFFAKIQRENLSNVQRAPQAALNIFIQKEVDYMDYLLSKFGTEACNAFFVSSDEMEKE